MTQEIVPMSTGIKAMRTRLAASSKYTNSTTYLVPSYFLSQLLRSFFLAFKYVQDRFWCHNMWPNTLFHASTVNTWQHIKAALLDSLNRNYVNRKKLYYKFFVKSHWWFLQRFLMLCPYLAGYLRKFWMETAFWPLTGNWRVGGSSFRERTWSEGLSCLISLLFQQSVLNVL